MDYTLHSIVRTKQFYPGISELVFKKPMSLHRAYKPGEKVYLMDYDKYYYIASGAQEVWARIIIDDIYINSPSIRLSRDITNDYPTLIGTEPSKTVYICDDLGIAPALSFFGTFPQDKFASVLYTHAGEGVNISWLKGNQNVKEFAAASSPPNGHIPIEKDYNYYICYANKDSEAEKTLIKDYLLNKGISDRVIFSN